MKKDPKLKTLKRGWFHSWYLASFMVIIIWFTESVILQAQNSKSSCIVDVSRPGVPVAPIGLGQQLEEFNHQFQGALYAQLIHNPSFEELINPAAEWSLVKTGESSGQFYTRNSIETEMLNKYQEHCLNLNVISVASGDVGVANGGYWGIAFKDNTTYKLSFWAKRASNFSGTIKVKLENNEGVVYAQSKDFNPTTDWQHFTCDLITKGVEKVTGNNRMVIYASSTGDVYFDVVTLMPPTWKNRPNGLRPDLAEKLDALKLQFVQFPGGCTAESAGMDVSWNWKNSIGPIEQRPGSTRSKWEYKNDLYFGLDDYFQLCEDLGAEPVYTTSSGISEGPWDKKWFGICPLDKMQPIIDDILDLLEYCNGSTSTKWGAKRAENGHSEPYNLKYLEIGNENGPGEKENDYSPRYAMIRSAVLAKYPETKIMHNGLDHTRKLSHTYGNETDFTDEHYYNMNELSKEKDLSGLYNQFDTIDPACKKICVAEYASSGVGHDGNVVGNFGDAIGDAIFNLGCEKNSERMWWTGYGNYASIIDKCVFGPCIVWNDAVTNFATPSYYVRKMLFSDNQGSYIVPFTQNTDNCYWSTSIDTKDGKNDLLLKVANNSATPETVNISLNGVGKVKPVGHLTMMSDSLDSENTILNPENVVPSSGSFKAGMTFNYNFPAYSVSVLRIELKK